MPAYWQHNHPFTWWYPTSRSQCWQAMPSHELPRQCQMLWITRYYWRFCCSTSWNISGWHSICHMAHGTRSELPQPVIAHWAYCETQLNLEFLSLIVICPWPILIYQGVHCCTKVCNLHLDDSSSKSRDNRMHWTRCNLLKWKGIYNNYESFTDQLQPIYFTCNDL